MRQHASATLAAALIALWAGGCGNPRADMGEQPKHKPYGASETFADGTSARPAVPGAIPRDDDDVPGTPYAWHERTGETSAPPGAPRPIPFAITREAIERGQVGFNAYCAACHGSLGNGQGMVVQRGLTPPPSFHVPRLREVPDSHIYDVITYGYGGMFGYAARVPSQERWEIVAYVRALQAAGETARPECRQALVAGGDRQHVAPAKHGGAR